MAIQIQLRRDTAANWATDNPVLADGELGWEKDTNKAKFGDGSTAWNSLAYFAPSSVPTSITVADTESSAAFVALFESATGDLGPKTDEQLTYNAATGLLTAVALTLAGALSGVSSLDATTEATIEAAIDTLANLTSIQGRTITLVDPGFDVLAGWDDSVGAYKNFLLADITAESAPASGDFFLMYGAEGDLRKVDFDDMPSGGGGGTPGGSDTEVQFNDGGSFGGDSAFVYDKTNNWLGINATPDTSVTIGGVASGVDWFQVHINAATGSATGHIRGLLIDQQTVGARNHNLWSGPIGITDYYGYLNGRAKNVFVNDEGRTSVLAITDNTGTGGASTMAAVNQIRNASGTTGGAAVIDMEVAIDAAGNQGNVDIFYAYLEKAGAGTTGRVAHFYAEQPTLVAGVITNLYGLLVSDQTIASNNWAIKTGLGLVEFGDLLLTVASASGHAGLRIPHGSAPSSPVDGDMWTTTAGAFIRINGVTKQFTLV